MEDHLVVLVDRLLTGSTLEAAMSSRNSVKEEAAAAFDESMLGLSLKDDHGNDPSSIKIVECRICLDEDSDSSMEAPCSCTGSLKYAHRRCVQKWCNEKGDTTCEICHQQFKPGYTAPAPMFQPPMNLRGSWRVARRDFDNRRVIAMVSTDPTFHVPDYSEFAAAPTGSQRNVMCRALATMFTVLLILGHVLPNTSRYENYPLMSMMLMLRIAGIIMSVCILLKAANSVLHQQQHQQVMDHVQVRLVSTHGMKETITGLTNLFLLNVPEGSGSICIDLQQQAEPVTDELYGLSPLLLCLHTDV